MTISRRQIISAGLALPVMVSSALSDTPVPQTAAAKAFIAATGTRVIAILRTASSPSVKASALYQEVLQSVAINHVGMEALGGYRGAVTGPQQTIYLDLFRRAVQFRLTQVIKMMHEPVSVRFRITAVSPHPPGYLVHTAIHQNNDPAVMVGWQVDDIAGTPKITDVLVQGFSMLRTVRASYTSVITDHDGNIDGLLAALRRQVR